MQEEGGYNSCATLSGQKLEGGEHLAVASAVER